MKANDKRRMRAAKRKAGMRARDAKREQAMTNATITKLAYYSLQVERSEHVAEIVRRNARAYREAAAQLNALWVGDHAGEVWEGMATILEDAARRINWLANKMYIKARKPTAQCPYGLDTRNMGAR